MFSSTLSHLLPQEKGQAAEPFPGAVPGRGDRGQGEVQVGLEEPFRVRRQLKERCGPGKGGLVGDGEHHQHAAGNLRVAAGVLDGGVRRLNSLVC
jgi:hypothetical protein